MKVVRTVSEDDLVRLKQARHEADARYNEALTALDAAIDALPAFAAAAPPVDESQVTPLNERWNVTEALPAPPSGVRGRLARFVLDLVRPALDRQVAFNAALVDHVNRNTAGARALPEAIVTLAEQVRRQAGQLERFQSRLIMFLQQVTPFVDTKDYEFNGLATRITEDVAEAHGQLADTVRGLAAALSGVSDDVLKRWERYEGLRTSLATMQLTVQALRRELARADGAGARAGAGPAPEPSPHATGTPAAEARPTSQVSPSVALSSDPLSAHKYVAFEDEFRGDRATIRTRQEDYLRIFAGRQDVLDVGCGRGEFLQLLAAHGVRARGIDLNHEMVVLCRDAGLDVVEADALGYLRARAAGELGGLIALQVVEHLEPDYLLAFLDEAFRTLSPGSPIVLETINVTSWSAFFSSYVRDLTHVRPLHPDTLRFVVTASGFLDAEVHLRSPLPESEKLLFAPEAARGIDPAQAGAEGRALAALVQAFDRNMERLNTQLYGPLDYAVLAWKR